MFVDASALCSVLLDEADATHYAQAIRKADKPVTSAVAIFETVLASARAADGDVGAARREVDGFLHLAGVTVMDIGEDELARALDAFDRFGKGRHPARLNMGDCFAYACAKTQGTTLLFKGDDFSQTDIAIA